MTATPVDILLVEDDPMTRLILGTLLREDGYRVREAVDLEEAYRQLAEKLPDLMVLDYYLPGGNGGEVLSSLPTPVAFPVLVVTGYDDEALRRRLLSAGARHFVVKDSHCAYLRRLPSLIADTLAEGVSAPS